MGSKRLEQHSPARPLAAAPTAASKAHHERERELYQLAIRATNDIVWDLDLRTNELSWNDALFTNLGFAQEDVGPTLQWWIDRIHPDDRDEVVSHFAEAIESGDELFTAEYRFQKADGSYAWIFDRGYLVRDASGAPVRGVGAMQDQTARKLSEQVLAKSETLSRNIIEANPDCVSLLDLDGSVLFSNTAAVRAYGLQDDRLLVGRRWGHRLEAKTQKEIDVALAAAAKGELGRLNVRLWDQAGNTKWFESIVSPVRDADGSLIQFLVMSRDITGHKAAERQIRWTANHDALTKLPNRLLFQQRLDELIATAAPGASEFALLLIDVDDFKQTNDTLGHDVGDQLLCAVAGRLQSAVRKDDLVARIGGDEFAILLRGTSLRSEILTISEKIIEELKRPWIHSGRVLDCRASMGASIYGRHGTEGGEILKSADVALYIAKERGRCRAVVFESKMRRDVQKRSQMIEDARCAVRENQLVPYYQPKVDLQTGNVIGWEALLRVQHPSRGLLNPAHVSAALEDMDVAADIGDRMVELVLTDVSRWLSAGFDIGHVAINVSAADFRRGDFAERLLDQLKRYCVPPEIIELEVTETVFLGRGTEHVGRALASLSSKGMRIALDDFGTGYASLSHLRQFPIDVIKIDRSFVRKMTTSASDAAIVRAVISLGKSLELDVVAEGIETPQEEARLRSNGCRFVQGYLYAKPMPATRVLGWMKRYRLAA